MKTIRLFAALAALVLCCSCAGTGKKPESVKLEPFTANDAAEGKRTASAFAEGFVTAIRNNDFEAWRPLIPTDKPTRITPEIFAGIREELNASFGQLENALYIGELQKGDLRDHLWKLRFVRDGKVNEVVFLVRVFRTQSGKPEISGFGIKRF